ncbi:MAG: hypothetical protein PQJ59_10530 [Spirochaetales bacterium]|nr:hypothetical protein [Spirochaetales bacterium]
MKKFYALTMLIFLIAPLFSLDIWINGEYHKSFDKAELREYSQRDFHSSTPLRGSSFTGELAMARIVPLFEEIYRIEAYGGRNRIVLEEPENLLGSLSFVFTGDDFYLSRGDYRFENPTRMDIWGTSLEEDKLIAIIPEEDNFTRERLETFCYYHDLDFTPIMAKDPAVEYNNRLYQKKELPHIVVFPETEISALEGKISGKRDYYFSVQALFSKGRTLRRPMDLEQILAESSHSYSWNCYDYQCFSLFTNYYEQFDEKQEDPLIQALVLNRSLKEMGILTPSSQPAEEEKDFFLEDTRNFSLESVICYPDFIAPLFNYTCLAVPNSMADSLIAESAGNYLSSSPSQSLLGWKRNGLYPVENTLEYLHPGDPCHILLNKYHHKGLRLSYGEEITTIMDNWGTLSRLAINSALSMSDLIKSSYQETEGVY